MKLFSIKQTTARTAGFISLILMVIVLRNPVTVSGQDGYADSQIQRPDTTRTLNEIIITASGIPTLVDKTLKPAVVISQTEIERHGGSGLSGLLHRQSGLFLSNAYAAPAENRRLKVQGAGDAYTIIMLDGAILGDPSSVSSLFDLRLISLSDIRRIEIVKGSQSTLYGSDAIGGVIHLFSKEPVKGERINGDLSLIADSYLGREGTVGISGFLNERLHYTARYSGRGTEGFSAASLPAGATTENRADYDKDGLQSHVLKSRVRYESNNLGTFTTSLQYGWYEGDFDGGAFQDAPNTYSSRYLHGGLQHSQTFTVADLKTSYHLTRTERSFNILNSFSNQLDTYEYEGLQQQVQTSVQFSPRQSIRVIGGAEGLFFSAPSEGDRGSSSAFILSGFLNSVADVTENIWLEAGLRNNYHSTFGSTWTYSTAVAYRPLPGLKISTGSSSGFKAPTLDQLYGLFGANPDLQPQTSSYQFAEVDMRLEEPRVTLRGQIYRRKTHQLIQYDFQQGYVNRNREEVWGIEGAVVWSVHETLQLKTSFNYLQGSLFSKTEIGETREDLFVLIPEQRWISSLHYDPSTIWSFRVEMDAVSSRTDLFYNPETFTTNRVSLEGYQLINLYGEYRIGNLHLFSTIQNLTDETFTEIFGFNSINRMIKTGLRYDF